MPDARITDLEVKFAFQEHALRELDDVLRALMDRVDQLQREVDELRSEQRSTLPANVDEKPPHYGS
jgi:uncharacterized coiled-coil protein SlyX